MKTVEQIFDNLKTFGDKYGLQVADAQQKSEAWYNVKLGVISASKASEAVAKLDSAKRATYMAELCAQVATGIMEEINSKYLDWGNQHEDAARSTYEFINGVTVKNVPFVFKDTSFRVGCSPDGIVSDSKGVEIKCPFNSVHFIQFMTDEKIKGDYVWQTQFTLWVMDADEWDFVQYDPRMKKNPIHTLTVKRDAEKMKVFDDMIPRFIEDMDKMLAKAGFTFGEHWTRIADVKS